MALLSTANVIVASLRVDKTSFELPPDLDWSKLVHHADGHSLTPLLYATWREAGLLDQLPGGIRRRMSQAYADNAQRNLYIRDEMLEIHRMLAGADIDHLVLKGWPLVEELYPDPARRVLYDHDFLVREAQAEAAYRLLKDAGFVPLPAKDEWVEKHLRPVWLSDGYEWDGYLFDPLYPRPVELHLRLWEQGWRGLSVENLANPWAEPRIFLIESSRVPVLSVDNTATHLAMHFAAHLVERDARLNQLLDLARFLQRNAAALNWPAIQSRAAQANVGRFIFAALFLAHDIYGAQLPPDATWRQLAADTPPAFRNWLTCCGRTDVLTADYRQTDRGKNYQLTFMASASIGERLGIVRFAALPPVGQLMAKYAFRRRWLGPVYYPRYLIDRLKEYSFGRRS